MPEITNREIKNLEPNLRAHVESLYVITQQLEATIDSMDTPVGHGTASEFFPSILIRGLGGEMPNKALAKSKSLTALHEPDGLAGAYLFAKTGLEKTLSFRVNRYLV